MAHMTVQLGEHLTAGLRRLTADGVHYQGTSRTGVRDGGVRYPVVVNYKVVSLWW